jgi:hypothetical protein
MRPRTWLGSLVVALLTLGTASAQSSFRVSDIVSVTERQGEPEAKKYVIDVVILSEGYTEKQRDIFRQKAAAVRRALLEDQVSEPMRTVTTFNFYEAWVPSAENGVPWRNGEPAGDTPFQAHITLDGSLTADKDAIDRAVRHVASKDHKTVGVVLIHTKSQSADRAANAPPRPEDGNTSPRDVRSWADTPAEVYHKLHRGPVDATANGSQIGRILQSDGDMRSFVHEFGHAGYGLGDEYANEPTSELPDGKQDEVAQYPNITTDPTGLRWRELLPDLFANGKIKEIHEGGDTYAKGVWHPFRKCRMNQTRTEPFCPVCQAIILGSNKKTAPLPTPTEVKLASGKDAKSVVAGWKWPSEEQPAAFHVELWKDGKRVWSGLVEGHLTEATIPVSSAGPFTVRVHAERLDMANPESHSGDAASPELLLVPGVRSVRGVGLSGVLEGRVEETEDKDRADRR